MNGIVRKRYMTLFIILGVAGVVFAIVWAVDYLNYDSRYIAQNCPVYTPHQGFTDRTEFVDCRGVIGIERYSDEEGYILFNELFNESNRNQWSSFRVNGYRIIGDNIYYIRNVETDNDYPTHSFAPYRIIDTKTAEIRVFETLENIAPADQQIFSELQIN